MLVLRHTSQKEERKVRITATCAYVPLSSEDWAIPNIMLLLL